MLKKKKKKKVYLSKKPIAKLRPHQMTGASQRASRAITKARQNSNKQSSVYLSLFFFGWSHAVCNTVYYKTVLIFYHQDAVFEHNLFHNNNSPEEMKRKQMNNHPNYNVIVSLD